MKRLLLAGASLALLAPAVLAQTAPPPAPTDQAAVGQAAAPPPPPDGGPGPRGAGGPGGWVPHGRGPGGPDGPEGPGRRGPPPPPSRAAHFHLERGDAVIDVKCADDEPMKACSDIASQLIDKLAALPADAMK